MLDLHNYPQPRCTSMTSGQPSSANMVDRLGKQEHRGNPTVTGAMYSSTARRVTNEYGKYAEQLKQLIRQGFSAAVYTQTTDVEVEVNGLMTYDRAVVKIDEGRVRKVNQEICNILNN